MFQKSQRIDYRAAIKFYGLDLYYLEFCKQELKKNQYRKKAIYSEKRLLKKFFNSDMCTRGLVNQGHAPQVDLVHSVFNLDFVEEVRHSL